MKITKEMMRPTLALRLVNVAILYVLAIDVVIPIINSFAGSNIHAEIHWEVLAAFMSQPIAWVTGRSAEKVKGGYPP